MDKKEVMKELEIIAQTAHGKSKEALETAIDCVDKYGYVLTLTTNGKENN